MEVTKRCYNCKQHKLLTDFHKSKRENDGRQTKCKDCCKEDSKDYRKNNQAYFQSWRKKHSSIIHGHLCQRWNTIRARCCNPKHKKYKFYGGRGIRNKFTSREFYDYVVDELGYDSVEGLKRLEIHRKNNSRGYEPGNIEFITKGQHIAKHKEMRKNKESAARSRKLIGD